MVQSVCPCPTCRRWRELAAKQRRAREILQSGEGFLSLNVYGSTGGTSNICIEAGDREGLAEAIQLIEDDIQGCRDRIETFGHGRGRRRLIRSRWMERR